MDTLALLKPFGIDLFCVGRKFLVFNMVSRNLKIKYRRSVLGVFWTLLSPIAQAAIFYFVFKVVLNIQTPHYIAFLLSGMLPWNFFSMALGEGTESIVGQVGLITKVPVPIQVFPLVCTLSNLVTLLIAVPVMVGATLLSGASIGPSIVMIIPYFAVLFLMAYGFSLIFAIFYVYLRDMKHLIGLLLQVWMYATPVVYDSSMIPEKYRWILFANPLGAAFVGFHRIFTEGAWPGKLETVMLLGWTVATVLVALILYACVSRNVAENL